MYRIVNELIRTRKIIEGRSYHTKSQRRALWWAFCHVRCWRFWYEKVSRKTPTEVSFLGFTVTIDTVGSFYGSFQEVFIREDYAFMSVPENAVIIDAGANIGLATLYLTWRFPGREVHAYEAHPDTFVILKKNIEINQLTRVQLHQKALHSSEGVITITGDLRAATVDTDMYTFKESTTDSFDVQAVTLSAECRIIGAAQFILKMDIEGSEYAVLTELVENNLIKKFSVIRFEFHTIHDEPNRLDKLKTLLTKAGYHTEQVTFDRNDHFILEVTAS